MVPAFLWSFTGVRDREEERKKKEEGEVYVYI